MKTPITRRQAITACVKSYIKKYPQDYDSILKDIRDKRAKMPSDSWGEVIKENGKKDDEIMLGMRLPAILLNQINEILKMHGQKQLFLDDDKSEADEEYQWFKRSFPQFIVPERRKRLW